MSQHEPPMIPPDTGGIIRSGWIWTDLAVSLFIIFIIYVILLGTSYFRVQK